MQLGYVIVYVQDVANSLAFFETAFRLKRRFLHESACMVSSKLEPPY